MERPSPPTSPAAPQAHGRTPVVYHPGYRDYNFGPSHPFSPMRLEMVLTLLEAIGVEGPDIEARPVGEEELRLTHDPDYVALVAAVSAGGALVAPVHGIGTPDVPSFPGMHEAARLIAGGTRMAAAAVADGPSPRALQLGGGLHHAHHDQASGFCIYNDLAVGIRHLLDRGLRVAYIDIDVHHGDGVQNLFYDRPDVLTISLHESGHFLFPGTGDVDELGQGAGRGYKLNVPLAPATGDASYLQVFERVVPHALAWFRPDVLLVQCGADAHFRDPLADLRLTTRAYETLFRRLMELADEHTAGRLVATLGGGYDFDATTRVWVMLYLLMRGEALVDRLPAEWIARWQPRLHHPMTPTLHDPQVRIDGDDAAGAAEFNDLASRRLLELAARHW
jgi:acetoin utilization protein AcuC